MEKCPQRASIPSARNDNPVATTDEAVEEEQRSLPENPPAAQAKIKLYSCGTCGFSCSRKDNLKRHETRHIHSKSPFVCSHCNKNFLSGSQLKDHQSTHVEEDATSAGNQASVQSGSKVVSMGEESDKNVPTPVRVTNRPHHCQSCSSCFSRKDILKKHEASCRKKNGISDPTADEPKYFCSVCRKAFPSDSQRWNHQRTHKKRLACTSCPRTFSTRSSLRRHQCKAVGSHKKPQSVFSCDRCHGTFSRKDTLKRHRAAHCTTVFQRASTQGNALSGGQMLPQNDGEMTAVDEDGKENRATSNGVRIRPHQCATCGLHCTRKDSLKKHEALCNGEGAPSSEALHRCVVCGASFWLRIGLTRHLRTHNPKKPFFCDVCARSFADRKTLRMHQSIHTNKKPHICDICGKAFRIRALLKNHKRTHSNEKSYLCDLCGAAFTFKPQLVRHSMQVHSQGKPFACSNCDAIFFTKGELDRHVRIHNNEKSFVCDVCGKAFVQGSYLTKHMRIHTNEKPHLCDICGKAFPQNTHLVKHRRQVHSQERPHVCGICNKAYPLLETLRLHERSHSDVKPYECHTCGKAFKLKHHLKNHQGAYHSSERPFVCVVCDKAFLLKHQLQNHQKTHNITRDHHDSTKYVSETEMQT